MTHAFIHLIFLNWNAAVQANALSIPLFFGSGIFGVALAFGFRPELSERSRRVVAALGLFSLLVFGVARNLPMP